MPMKVKRNRVNYGKELVKLKAYRQLNSDKQSDLAQYLCLGVTTYNHKENGKIEFTISEAKKIADRYKTTIEDIFFSDTVNFKNTV